MSNYIVSDSDLTSVANAIRTKGGTSAQLAFPAGFVSAIGDIPTGGSGDYTAADFADRAKPVGDVVFTDSYMGSQNSSTAPNYFAYRTAIDSIYAPNYNNTSNCSSVFRNCSMKYGVFPKLTKIYNNYFYGCSKLERLDFLGGTISGSSGQIQDCSKLSMIVIRSSSVCSLGGISALSGTPFASGKAGGTLYVPSDLVSSYQSASNWSTILGYATNSIKSIESTHTDPNAPIDLTLYYADGTLIPT